MRPTDQTAPQNQQSREGAFSALHHLKRPYRIVGAVVGSVVGVGDGRGGRGEKDNF